MTDTTDTPVTNKAKLKIVSWNIHSVKNRRIELQHICDVHKPDIVLLQETIIADGDRESSRCKISGYDRYITNGNILRTQIATYCKKNILSVEAINIPNRKQQMAAFKINKEGMADDFIVANVYTNHYEVLDTTSLEEVIGNSGRVIIGGDFNAIISKKNMIYKSERTGIVEKRDNKLEEFIETNTLYGVNVENEPTNFTNFIGKTRASSSQTTIDHILIHRSMENDVEEFQRLDDIGGENKSFHMPIMLTLEYDTNYEKTPRINFKKLNHNEYQKCLKDKLLNEYRKKKEISSTNDIDEEMKLLTRCIMDVILELIPPTISKKKFGWMPSNNLFKMIKEKKKAFRKYCKSRDELERHVLKKLANDLANQVRYWVEKEKDEYYDNAIKAIEKMHASSSIFWQNTNKLAGIKKGGMMKKPLKFRNKIARKNLDRANMHLEYQETIFKENDINTDETKAYWKDIIIPRIKIMNDIDREELDFPEITIQEIAKALSNTKIHKAGGRDDMKAICLKWGPKELLGRLAELFNACIKYKYQPPEWKQAVIILIPKPGKDHADPAGFRPISLLTVMAKLIEKIMCKRMRVFVENATSRDDDNKPFLPDEQSGFRCQRQTTDNIFRIMQMASQALQQRDDFIIASLDGRKAFDTCAHKALLSPLIDLYRRNQLPFYIVSFYKQFLSERTFKIREGTEMSDKIGSLSAGLPQGSNSAPFLYIMFTADMPMPTNDTREHTVTSNYKEVTKKFKEKNFIAKNPQEVGLFADDIATWSKFSNKGEVMREAAEIRFQSFLDKLLKWANERKIVFNKEKTQLLKMSNKYNTKENVLKFGGTKLEYGKELKYLGVIFNKDLDMRKYFETLRRKSMSRIKRLGFITRRGNIHPFTAKRWMQTLVHPLMLYGAMAWLPTEANHAAARHTFNQARRHACMASRGTTNTWLNEYYTVEDPINWCQNVCRKWLDKTVGPNGYRNRSVMKSIRLSAKFPRFIPKKSSIKMRRCVSPLEMLLREYKPKAKKVNKKAII